MERRLKREEVMTIAVLHERGMSKRGIARQLGVDEKAVRYRLARARAQARDRRADQVSSVAPWSEAIVQWRDAARCPGAGRLGGVPRGRGIRGSPSDDSSRRSGALQEIARAVVGDLEVELLARRHCLIGDRAAERVAGHHSKAFGALALFVESGIVAFEALHVALADPEANRYPTRHEGFVYVTLFAARSRLDRVDPAREGISEPLATGQ